MGVGGAVAAVSFFLYQAALINFGKRRRREDEEANIFDTLYQGRLDDNVVIRERYYSFGPGALKVQQNNSLLDFLAGL